MEALKKRNIQSGLAFDKLLPKSIKQDKVIRKEGKARLHHTINLIKQIVPETTGDTHLLANYLRGENIEDTCRNVWEFVYNHIQYQRDKTGIEQVRRPSRSWADRKQGVDCDCYTVFISSILTNLKIPHKVRITKYGGKQYYQHIYPIVPINQNSFITLDCVTDQFNYEVPYSEAKDFPMDDRSPVGEINGICDVSGVDSADLLINGLGIYNLKQPKQPLRQIVKRNDNEVKSKLVITPMAKSSTTSQSKTPVANTQSRVEIIPAFESRSSNASKKSNTQIGLIGRILIVFGVGLGTYKLTEILT
ncbi:MAG: transglutaminase-like domain-containing protein [Cyclobacteriaceae bacterium]